MMSLVEMIVFTWLVVLSAIAIWSYISVREKDPCPVEIEIPPPKKRHRGRRSSRPR